MESLLRRFRIRHRIWFLLALAFVAMALLIALTLKQSRNSFSELKVSELRHLTESATALMVEYNRRVEAGELTIDEAQSQVKVLIHSLRWTAKISAPCWM